MDPPSAVRVSGYLYLLDQKKKRVGVWAGILSFANLIVSWAEQLDEGSTEQVPACWAQATFPGFNGALGCCHGP